MIRKKAIICDLDGTLCNIDHRLHYVKTKPKNWKAFEKACVNDPVVQPVFELVNAMHEAGFVILFVSGRSEDRLQETKEWLFDAFYYTCIKDDFWLKMRKSQDSRVDHVVKSEILDELQQEFDIVFAIDDRKQVKRMWVERGVFVLDVNQHDIEF